MKKSLKEILNEFIEQDEEPKKKKISKSSVIDLEKSFKNVWDMIYAIRPMVVFIDNIAKTLKTSKQDLDEAKMVRRVIQYWPKKDHPMLLKIANMLENPMVQESDNKDVFEFIKIFIKRTEKIERWFDQYRESAGYTVYKLLLGNLEDLQEGIGNKRRIPIFIEESEYGKNVLIAIHDNCIELNIGDDSTDKNFGIVINAFKELEEGFKSL